MTDAEAGYVGRSVVEVIRNYKDWSSGYVFHKESGEFEPKDGGVQPPELLSRFSVL
jgi:hypothetical protein